VSGSAKAIIRPMVTPVAAASPASNNPSGTRKSGRASNWVEPLEKNENTRHGTVITKSGTIFSSSALSEEVEILSAFIVCGSHRPTVDSHSSPCRCTVFKTTA
jgi:hypothetical protein